MWLHGLSGSSGNGHWRVMTKTRLSTSDRLTQVETDTKSIRTDIRVIKENHLKHLETDMAKQSNAIEKIDTRVWAILFSIILLIGSTLLSIVLGQ